MMMTMKELKKYAKKLRMTVTYNPNVSEYRVNYEGEGESSAYYTPDRDDAKATLADMAKRKYVITENGYAL